jgi:hypothetical protein
VMGQFIENPALSQGERTIEEALVQHANLASIEAVKTAHGVNTLDEFVLCQCYGPPRRLQVRDTIT